MIEDQVISTYRRAISTEHALHRTMDVPDVMVDDRYDDLITPFGKDTLIDRYLLPGESFQDRFANCVRYYANDATHAQRLYEYIAKQWWIPATPILSNGGTIKGNLISCFLGEVEDSLEGIVESWVENIWLAAKGGGLGIYYGGVRGRGERAGVNGKTTGAMSFVKVNDALTLCISQGSLRRGNAAIYMDVSHPEIETFVDMRMETGGDPAYKALNLHHGVCITDAFYEAALNGDEWPLISPHTGEVVKKISARHLFEMILERRMAKGEPYILNIDTVNRSIPEHHKKSNLLIKTSNLCVAPETKLLTKNGYVPIKDIAGTDQEVWNGKQWALARVEKTGESQKLIAVTLSNGVKLNVTPKHRFKIQTKYGSWSTSNTIVEAADLKPEDKLIKVDYPVIRDGSYLSEADAYRNGFYSADGTDDKYGNPRVYLYGDKRWLISTFEGMDPIRISYFENEGKRHAIYFRKDQMLPKYTVPIDADINGRLDWLAGYLDGDGTVARNGDTDTIQMTSVNEEFLHQIRLMLTTLGITSTLVKTRDAGVYSLPDGNGGLKEYECNSTYRMCITAGDTQRLLELGLKCRRLVIRRRKVQRDAQQFITVVSVEDEGRIDDTYCFNEPIEHMGIFEGVPTMNCSEITLPTGRDHHDRVRTAVCCLSQTNFETYEEWEHDPNFVLDIAYFMDNVLQDFIDNGGDKFINARYSAMRERSIGVGMLGFHTFLQKKSIPFESAMAKVWNMRYFKNLRTKLNAASVQLAEERGACPDAAEHGIMERFSNKIAIAPTASTSIICGSTSAGGDPIPTNYYTHKTKSGTFEIKNKYLERLLEEKGHNTHEVWMSILDNGGSVQHLDFLSDHEKEVYKTSFEVDPRWFLEHAADRQKWVCQAQSLNLWIPPTIDKRDLLQLHFLAWRLGIKSLYYLRSYSTQRADSTSGAERKVNHFTFAANTDFEECIACQ